jgi:hypothetical protein
LGHRVSFDFNFFSSRPFQPLDLVRSISYLRDQAVTQQGADTLSCDIRIAADLVKVSFFGGLTLGRIEAPDVVEINGVAIASLNDLFGMKCATVV